MSPRMRRRLSGILCYACSFSLLWGQEMSIAPVRPFGPFVFRPYRAPVVPPLRLANSPRLHDLIRAGVLYLTVQDAIALALENNLDIEVARYNPLIAAWNLERFQAGGTLPGVPSGASQAGSVASGQGVAGSQAAAGVGVTSASTRGNRTTNATITQVGPVVQTLDPSFQDATTFSHVSTPEPDTLQSVVANLVQATHVYNASYQQGFLTGGSVSANYTEHYLSENAPTDNLNPTVAPNLSISFQQYLLNGFGVAVNSRNITVGRINLNTSDLTFRTQVIGAVTEVLNLYWGLAADYEDVRAKQSALDVARTLSHDTQEQVRIGTLAPLDQSTAESQVAAAERDLVDSQTTLAEQELQLKSMLSRVGTGDPLLAAARIVPVDHIEVPAEDTLPPVNVMVQQALGYRTDLAAERAGIQTSEVSSIGTRNGLLPTAVVFGTESQVGLSGTRPPVLAKGVPPADPYFVGGMQNALGQVFRRNFPSDSGGFYFGAPLRNRQAQADYGIDQLSLRQTQLNVQKDINQVQVDVRNYVVAMRQARARYTAAAASVRLQQQLYDAENKKLGLGASTPSLVIQEQRDLSSARSAVIAAEATYVNARVALDQALGRTLEVNHVEVSEARSARVARKSAPEAAAPQAP